uniref:Ovule protein n=1 Tax=Haemonchus placei TaxID=6290 RepID=A0A0N4W524_HAEPC
LWPLVLHFLQNHNFFLHSLSVVLPLSTTWRIPSPSRHRTQTQCSHYVRR